MNNIYEWNDIFDERHRNAYSTSYQVFSEVSFLLRWANVQLW
jgi:hypothetical protein